MRGTLGKKAITGAAIGAAVLAVVVLQLPPRPLVAPRPDWRPAGATMRGVFHVHTVRSDGTGTVDEVAAAAADAGLQFVIFTDHGDATRAPDPPTYRGRVLCIDAVEISTAGGHYAALGLGQAPYPLGGEPRDVVDDVRRLGGFGIVTHPYSARPEMAWHGWGSAVDAIEWLNGDSQWRDAPLASLARAALTYAFRPSETLAALFRRPVALEHWDALARVRPTVGIAGSDAHARLGFREPTPPYARHSFVEAPGYLAVFGAASLQVWLPQPPTRRAADDAAALIRSIRAGHVHTVIDAWAAPGAFEFTARAGGVTAHEGDRLAPSDAVVVETRAAVPAGGEIVLFRDGAEVHRMASSELTYASDRGGVYRAEVWLANPRAGRPAPWIVGNPIYVGSGFLPAGPPRADIGPVRQAIGCSAGLALEKATGSGGGVVCDESTFRVRYQLGAGEPAGPYAALRLDVAPAADTAGLAFSASADRPMRISVQLRGVTGGVATRWQRSVYLDHAERQVVVPFAEMTPVGLPTGARPDASRVRAILFVVDTVNSTPTARGSFSVRDLRLWAREPAGQ
jgi:hypothetical protein